MKKILFLLSLLCIYQLAIAQQLYNQNTLQQQLKASNPDTGRIGIFLKMAEYNILKPGSYKTDLDSAVGFIHAAEKLNQTVKSPESTGYITMVQADLAREHNDKSTGIKLMEKAIQELSPTNNKLLLGEAYQGLSDYYDFLDLKQLPLKEKYLQRAADLYKEGGFIADEASCDKTISEIVVDDTLAFKKILEAMRLFQSISYKKMQGVYDDVATCYAMTSQLRLSLKYELLALNSAKDEADSSGTLVEIYNHLGMTYHDLNEYKSSIEYYRDGLAAARLNKDIESEIYLTINLCSAYLHENDKNEARKLLDELVKVDISATKTQTRVSVYADELGFFTTLESYENARQASLKLIPLLKRTDFDESLMKVAHSGLINYYLDFHQLTNARKYLKILDSEQNKNTVLVDKITQEAYWYRLDTALHQYKQANYRLISELTLDDSINKISKSKEIQSLQIEFKTKEKEGQIALLEKNSLLQSANLKQADTVRNFTIGSSILLFIIALLLYRQNFLKQRSSKIISNKNALLQRLLDEKEWLLKEVHHRVKNNLHTVICLLESQAAYLENDALKAIENSQHRIYAMSLIHQKLYQSDDIKTIDMDVYLKEFLQYLDDSFGNPNNIRLQSDIEPVKLGVAQAIPVGLIINEAVTNAYKYAFPNKEDGIIQITLHQSENLLELMVSDNGIGMTIVDNFDDAGSLGMELIKGLARDISGQLKLEGINGTSIRILFEVNLLDRVSSGQVLPILT